MIKKDYLELLGECYEKGEFSALHHFVGAHCVWESDWRQDSENGKEEVVAYYSRKASILQRCKLFPVYMVVDLFGSEDSILGLGLLLSQKIEGMEYDLIITLRIGQEEKISHIKLCMKELFRFREHDVRQATY